MAGSVEPAMPPARGAPSSARAWWLPSWRRLGWLLVLLLVAGFVYLHRGEWGEIRDAAGEADGGMLALAACVQAVWLVAFGAMFWASYAAVDAPLPFRRTLALSWAANFVNTLVKSGGISGMALFLRAAARRGHPGSRATLGYLLVLVLGYVEFLLLLAATLIVLWLDGELRRYELAASALTVAFLVSLIGGAIIVAQSAARVRRTYGLLARLLNPAAALLQRGPLLHPDGAHRAGEESEAAAQLVRAQPARLLPAALAGAAKESCAVAVMYLVLRAFGAEASLPLALAAYTLTILFSYISILPSGLGIVELSLTAFLIREGIAPAPAALTTIVFRLFQFWTPFLVGAVATRWTGSASSPAPAGEGRG